MSVLDELGAYLATKGIGTVGVDLFLGFMPDKPDACVALYETGGMAPVRAMRSGAGDPAAQRPSVKAISRNTQYEYKAASAKARAIKNELDGLGDVTLSGTPYYWIGAVAEPAGMGHDPSDARVRVSVNFDIVKGVS